MNKPEFGLLAQFGSAEELKSAVQHVREAGYRKFDAHSPFPVEGLYEEMGRPSTILPAIVFCGGLTGCLGGFLLQYYASVISYPLNIGGRPWNSWPAFIPITFEMTILLSAITAFASVLVLNRLPQWYHPLFNVPDFDAVTENGFFLSVERSDPLYDRDRSEDFLRQAGAIAIREVQF